MKSILKKIKDETGQAFILVLILLAVGGAILTPLLSHMGTGMKTEILYEERADEFHSADSGVEDALWQIKYDNLANKFTSPAYNPYNYDIFGGGYAYDTPLDINSRDVDVTITNIWIPKIDPDPVAQGFTSGSMQSIVEAGNIIVAGTIAGPTTYQIKISYTPLPGETLRVSDIGIWLPTGFTYVEESSNLEENELFTYYPSDVDITSHAGGQAIIWHYDNPGILFNSLPEVETSTTPWLAEITFEFDGPPGRVPEAVAWMVTSPASISGAEQIQPFAWDADVKVFLIESTAGSVDIDAYAIKSELREVQGAIAGDYRAVGNSLMAASWNERYRDTLLDDSSATVSDIPEDANVAAAYLYWSAWMQGNITLQKIGDSIWEDDCDEFGTFTSIWSDDCSAYGTYTPVWSDDCSAYGTYTSVWSDDCSSLGTWNSIWQENCSSFDDAAYTWSDGSQWIIYGGEFRGQGGGISGSRTLTLAQNIDLSAYAGQTVNISWDQDASNPVDWNDYLYFAISNDGGGSWSSDMEAFHDDDPLSPFIYTIPQSYLTSQFRIRYYWAAGSSNEYCYLDNIGISALVSSNWSAGSHWTVNGGQFQGQGGGTTDDRTLTRITDIDLSAYAGQTVNIGWDQSEYGYIDWDDYLYFAISNDGGSSWSSNIEAFHDDNPSSPFSYTIPQSYLTSQFRIRFLWSADSTSEYCYIDNIEIGTLTGDWSPGANWTISSGQFQGQGGGTTDDRTVTRVTDIDLSAYSGQTVNIGWDQSEYGYIDWDDYLYFAISNDGGGSWSSNIEAFHDDNPSSPFSYTIPQSYLTSQFRIRFLWSADSTSKYCYIDNIGIGTLTGDWSPGANWTISSGQFQGQGGGTTDDRTVTRITDIDLSAYAGQTVNIGWDQSEYGYIDWDDYLYFAISNDGGSSWSSNIEAFHDDNPSSPFSYTIPQSYLTSQFRIRFLWSADSTSEYCYIDNIEIGTMSGDWSPGANWTIYGSDQFMGQGGGTTAQRTLTMITDIDLSAYSGSSVAIFWNQRETGYLWPSEGLYFAISGNGGSSWSSNEIAFTGEIGSTAQEFSFIIPEVYLTENFRIRFFTQDSDSGDAVYIDDLAIYEIEEPTIADPTAKLWIDGQQVYFDGDGNPAEGNDVLNAELIQVIENTSSGTPHGYSYSCKLDVTDLILEYSAEVGGGYRPGNAVYTVGDVFGDAAGTGTVSPYEEWAYAGWSLVIIYTSPETAGHRMYLYDNLVYCDSSTNLDFDADGQPGGTITGFLVPEMITGEGPTDNAAKITCFVCEGDDEYDGDFIALNAPDNDPPASISDAYKLWDGTGGSLNDVWNSRSIGLSETGVDIDTFNVTWGSGLISPGDTSAQIDMYTNIDIWNFIYIIMSFRSETATGGTTTYLIY